VSESTDDTPQLERWGSRLLLPIGPRRYRDVTNYLRASKYKPHQGKREMERRAKQRRKLEASA
jgi:hypothetical protein